MAKNIWNGIKIFGLFLMGLVFQNSFGEEQQFIVRDVRFSYSCSATHQLQIAMVENLVNAQLDTLSRDLGVVKKVPIGNEKLCDDLAEKLEDELFFLKDAKDSKLAYIPVILTEGLNVSPDHKEDICRLRKFVFSVNGVIALAHIEVRLPDKKNGCLEHFFATENSGVGEKQYEKPNVMLMKLSNGVLTASLNGVIMHSINLEKVHNAKLDIQGPDSYRDPRNYKKIADLKLTPNTSYRITFTFEPLNAAKPKIVENGFNLGNRSCKDVVYEVSMLGFKELSETEYYYTTDGDCFKGFDIQHGY